MAQENGNNYGYSADAARARSRRRETIRRAQQVRASLAGVLAMGVSWIVIIGIAMISDTYRKSILDHPVVAVVFAVLTIGGVIALAVLPARIIEKTILIRALRS